MIKAKLIYVHDWEKGGQNGRRQLNDRRLIETSEGERYYEIKIGEDLIAKCDPEHLELLNTYRWGATKTAKGYCVRTDVKDKKKLHFARAVMKNPPGEIVIHVNNDTLDNRRSNLKIQRAKVNSKLDYKIEPLDESSTIKNTTVPESSSEWKIGRLGGSISCRNDDHWRVVFQKPFESKTFSKKTYGNLKRAELAAREFHKTGALERGLVSNRYRVCLSEHGDSFLEVQAYHKGENLSFFCDVEDLELVKKYNWGIGKRSRSEALEVVAGGGNRPRFHTELGLYEVTDHIDGNPLNNRRCNLRDGKLLNARNHPKRKDNASGMTGVSFIKSKNSWVVQWPENGKRNSKFFYIREGKRTHEQALEEARKFRLEIDKRLNLHNQQYLDN